jgi:hypothetical protein
MKRPPSASLPILGVMRLLVIKAGVLAAAAALCVAAAGTAAPARAADATLELLDFYAFPENAGQMNKLEGYAWPAVQRLSALVRVRTAGYEGERDVEVFFVVRDERQTVVDKIKQKHPLPAGTHDLVVPDFIRTEEYFGRHTVELELELTMDGAGIRRGYSSVDFSGPDPPPVEIHRIRVYNPEGGYRDTYFEPGDTFMVEATIEIGPNPSGLHPEVTIYAVMDEDAWESSPDGEYETYYKQWDSAESDYATGQFRLRATGWLPHFFAEPWDYYHPFKIYLIVSFGPGAEYGDYAQAELFDAVGGDVRQTDDLEQRLIEIAPGYNWEFRRGRAPFDDY